MLIGLKVLEYGSPRRCTRWAVAGGSQCFSAKRKLAFPQWLLPWGELGKVLSCRNVPAHRLTEWRAKVLMGADSWLNERERSARDDEIARLHAKLGVINIGNELLYTTIDKLEADRPLARHSHISTT